MFDIFYDFIIIYYCINVISLHSDSGRSEKAEVETVMLSVSCSWWSRGGKLEYIMVIMEFHSAVINIEFI